MNRCNYCIYEGIRERVKRGQGKEKIVKVINDDGGVDVFVVPGDLKKEDVLKNREEYFVAWFMGLSDKCCC